MIRHRLELEEDKINRLVISRLFTVSSLKINHIEGISLELQRRESPIRRILTSEKEKRKAGHPDHQGEGQGKNYPEDHQGKRKGTGQSTTVQKQPNELNTLSQATIVQAER